MVVPPTVDSRRVLKCRYIGIGAEYAWVYCIPLWIMQLLDTEIQRVPAIISPQASIKGDDDVGSPLRALHGIGQVGCAIWESARVHRSCVIRDQCRKYSQSTCDEGVDSSANDQE